MLYGWEVLLKNLKKYEEENAVLFNTSKKDIRLSAFMERVKNCDLWGLYQQHFYHREKTSFVISFSEKDDDLNMWSKYGGRGSGVCLCFDESCLTSETKDFITYPLMSVAYINQAENNEITLKVLADIISIQYQTYLQSRGETDMEKIQSVGALLPIVGTYVKHNAYVDEKEMRLAILAKHYNESVKFRVSNIGNIIPYIEVPVLKDSLKRIIIGPCANGDSIEMSLTAELEVCGLNVPLSSSSVPYREL